MHNILVVQIYLLIGYILLASSSSYADYTHTKIELQKVLSQITTIKKDIIQGQQQQINVKEQLTELTSQMYKLNNELKTNVNKLKKKNNLLKKLKNNQIILKIKLVNLNNKISSQFRFIYMMKNNKNWKYLLTIEKNRHEQQILIYHKYLRIAYIAQKRDINEFLNRLSCNTAGLQKEAKKLQYLEKKQENNILKLELIKKHNDNILQELKNKILKHNKKLNQLLYAKNNLEKLISSLSSKSRKITQQRNVNITEIKMNFCRNFIWPTKGKIVTHFGSSIEHSSWKWNAVVISAPENQEVRAIADGTVVYANKLTGYGLLLIIDHGNNCISLYGYNSNLKKSLNTKVKTGDIISYVGKNNDNQSGLYFSIRHNGKSVNPERLYGMVT